MKYRLLSDDELETLSDEFTHFLIVNGVHHEEWVEMNRDHPDQALALVEIFSDTVWQKVYEKLRFIEFRTKDSCMVFRLNPDHIDLISINAKPGSSVDLSTPESVHAALVEHPEALTMFRNRKAYTEEREAEIHRMISQGCVHSSEEFWKALEQIIG